MLPRRASLVVVVGLLLATACSACNHAPPLQTRDAGSPTAPPGQTIACEGQPDQFWHGIAERGLSVPIVPSAPDDVRYYTLLAGDGGQQNLLTVASNGDMSLDEAARCARDVSAWVPILAPAGVWPNQTNADQWERVGSVARVKRDDRGDLVSMLEAYRLRGEWETDPQHLYVLYRVKVFSPERHGKTSVGIETRLDSAIVDYGNALPERALSDDQSDLLRRTVATKHVIPVNEYLSGQWILVAYSETQKSARMDIKVSVRSDSASGEDSYGLEIELR